MEAKRWTLGIVLAAAVSLFGLIRADASPFSMYILSDDLGNFVHGVPPEQGEWDSEPTPNDGSDGMNDSGAGSDSGGSAGGAENGGGTGSGSDDTGNGKDKNKTNNGHGNNEDGVDSSNPGKGKGGPNGAPDASCPEGGPCVDDEKKNGASANGADDATPTAGDGNNGHGNNADGVDSSNKGNSKAGEDTDPTVDDEAKGGSGKRKGKKK